MNLGDGRRCHETSPPTISASGRGRCRAAGRLAHRKGASLSVAAGAFHRRLCAGRCADIIARLMGQWLSERLGQPFVIENRPAPAAISAPRRSSGHLRMATRCCWLSANAINATLYEKLSFNFIRDVAPVASICASPTSWWSIHRFRPKRFPNSSPMPRPIPARSIWRREATGPDLTCAGELFKMMTGVNIVHVPYRGAAPALTDLLGGQVQVMFPSTPRRSNTSGPANSARWR